MIFFYGEARRNVRQAVRLFNAAHPDREVSPSYVQSLVAKFTTTFSVKDAPRSGRPRVRTDEMQVYVLGEYNVDPRQSLRNVARACGLSRGTIHTILKANKFHPYKVQLHQELSEDDPDRRIQFCETVLDVIRADPGYLQHVCFSDEASFFLHGAVNRHNCRYWSEVNPHWMEEAHTQHPQKLNVWAGILGDRIIGPFFIPGALNGRLYVQMLEDFIIPSVVAAVEDGEDDFDPVFQQDGAPPHYFRLARQLLDAEFPGRWIGRRGAIEWPARSPDLTPLDFFLWGYLKDKVYVTPPENLQELRMRITTGCLSITPDILRNVRQAFEARLYYCQEVQGAHFEHLL